MSFICKFYPQISFKEFSAIMDDHASMAAIAMQRQCGLVFMQCVSTALSSDAYVAGLDLHRSFI